MEECPQTRHAPMNNGTRARGRLRRKPQGEWEKVKPIVCELYPSKTLEEVRELLQSEHNIQVTKRQLVYRMEKWGLRKYNTGGSDSAASSDGSPKYLARNLRVSRFPARKALNSLARSTHYKLAPRALSLSTRDTDKSGGFNETNQLSNDKKQDPEADYADYAHLTRLMIHYMEEAMASGDVFMDSADHVGNGSRLFRWADGATEAIKATRVSSVSDTTATPAWKYLSDDVSLQSILVNENPLVLGTIFAIWKSAALVDDGDKTSKMFLSAVLRNCETLLAPNHHITGIFKCLTNGSFDPEQCIDRLGVLPSEIFSRGTRTLDPSFEFDATSDYQTIAPLPVRQNQPGLSTTGLQLKRFLSQRDTSAFMSRASDTPKDTVSNASLPFSARSQSNSLVNSSGIGSLIYNVPSVSVIKCESESGLEKQSPYSFHGSPSESISPCSTPEPQTLESEKKRIVDSIMREFLENMDTYLGVIYEDGGAGGTSAGDVGMDGHSENKGRGVFRSTGCGKRNRPGKYAKEAGDREGNGADDEDDQRDGGSSKKPKLDSKSGRPARLACPYFKWNPRKYRHHRVCVSPGWTSVHRVKEHLHRCHEKPLYRCRRCNQDLKEEAALEVHQREDPPCDIVVWSEPCDKYGTEKASRLRKRADGRKSEKEQWVEVYRILFDVLDDELPSPYCEDFNLAFESESWPEHVQREARPLLRELLATQVAQALTNIAPEILQHLRDLVRQLEPRLRQSYQQSQDQDWDRDHNHNQQGEEEVDEEDEDEEEEVDPAIDCLNLAPTPQVSRNIPHAFTSASITYGPTADTSTNMTYRIPNTLSADLSSSIVYREDHGVDAFAQTLNPPMSTWAADVPADDTLQSGSLSGPTLASTGGFLLPHIRVPPPYDQQDPTDLQEWNVIGRYLSSDDTSFEWDNW